MVNNCAQCNALIEGDTFPFLVVKAWSLQSKSFLEFVFCTDEHMAAFLDNRHVGYNLETKHIVCEVD